MLTPDSIYFNDTVVRERYKQDVDKRLAEFQVHIYPVYKKYGFTLPEAMIEHSLRMIDISACQTNGKIAKLADADDDDWNKEK